MVTLKVYDSFKLQKCSPKSMHLAKHPIPAIANVMLLSNYAALALAPSNIYDPVQYRQQGYFARLGTPQAKGL